MKIHPIITNNELQNIFYIIEYGEGRACIIDPCDSSLAKDFLARNSLELDKIIVTHEHHDHYSGVSDLDCEEIYTGIITGKNIPLCFCDELLQGESIILEEDLELTVVETPGHTPGHITLELKESGEVLALFVGDTIFAGGVGNNHSGDSGVLYESIQKFKKYGDIVPIYSGHDYLENNFRFIEKYFPEKQEDLKNILMEKGDEVYFTNIGEERKINPFLSTAKDEFIRLRELRNTW